MRPDLVLPEPGQCSVSRTLAIVGEKWTLLVLQAAFFGIRRFEEFQRHLTIPRPVLSGRLATLVDHGLLDRVPYREEGQRERHEYRLTTKGRDLYPALLAVMRWGDRYLDHPAGRPPVDIAHRDCGGRVSVEMTCEHGHHLDSVRQAVATPAELPTGAAAGPGTPAGARGEARARRPEGRRGVGG
jgi:DNA-binding HxlR family transcriptional regulator